VSNLGPNLAEPHRHDVPNLDRVERLPDASHRVHRDEAERVPQLLIDFFAAVRHDQHGPSRESRSTTPGRRRSVHSGPGAGNA
jgi:hypothetical protein